MICAQVALLRGILIDSIHVCVVHCMIEGQGLEQNGASENKASQELLRARMQLGAAGAKLSA